MDKIQPILDKISEHAWLLGSIRALVVLIALYIVYKFIMSPWGRGIRTILPILDHIHTNRLIKSYLSRGEFSLAGDKMLELGKHQKAVDIFQQGRLYSRAADVYLQRKSLQKAALMFEKAGELNKAANIYIAQKQHDRLSQMYAQNNAIEELGTLYAEHGEHLLAAEIFQNSNKPVEAARQFMKAGKDIEAARNLEKFLEKNKIEDGAAIDPNLKETIMKIASQAAVLFEKEKYYDKASVYYLQSKNPKKAAECLNKAGKHEEAGKLAKQHGLLGDASMYYSKANLGGESARLEADHLYQSGQFHEAIEKYKISGDYSKCAEIYTDIQDYHMAAQMHEMAGDHRLAAEMFKDEKDYARAGENFEKAGLEEEALDAYHKGKLEHLELDLLSRKERYVDLAKYFLQRRLYEQANSSLDRVKPHDPDFPRASSVRGQIYYDQKKYSEAKDQFEKALEGVVSLNKDHLDTLFFFAKCDMEATGQALETIENKMAMNQIEPDALEKAKEIRKLIQEKSFTRLQSFSQFVHQSQTQSNPNFTGARSMGGMPNLEVPQRYEAVSELGRGGMGVVYLAKDKVLDREVALKILPAKNNTDQRTVDTFLREAKAAASLNHPNIVTVFDTGMQDGDYFIAMEHIDGYTIKKILKQKGKFTIPVVKEIVKQLIKALSYAHQNNIVHRDLTTSNIMWTKQKLIKIMDFGLAKVVKKLQSEQSIIGGTPSFMSPEQTLGKPVDHRTDIYSLGICMFEMALGSLPFTKGDLGYHHLHTAPPVPNEVDPSIPKALSDAILKCMEKKLEDRYQSVEELVDVLKDI